MENPDVEMEIKRDKEGFVIGMAYKVNNAGEEDRRPTEFVEIVTRMFTGYLEGLKEMLNNLLGRD